MLTVSAILAIGAVFFVARFLFKMLAGIVAAACAAAVGLVFFPQFQAPALAWALHGIIAGASNCAFGVCG
jgi:hypothetical protein